LKNFFLNHNATLTRLIRAGTFTSGPMIAANSSPEFIPNTAAAIASSKLLLATGNEMVGLFLKII
jgi:hypothetical protein